MTSLRLSVLALLLLAPGLALAHPEGHGGGPHASPPSRMGAPALARGGGAPSGPRPSDNVQARGGAPLGLGSGPQIYSFRARSADLVGRGPSGGPPGEPGRSRAYGLAVAPASARLGPTARGPSPATLAAGGGQPFAYRGREYVRYRSLPYRWPAGYWGGRFGPGEWLPGAYFNSDYFIGDYWDFGLFAPDPGLQWIRVGADALLVDVATGEIVDVVPGVYY